MKQAFQCPKCGGRLVWSPTSAGCTDCDASYPIIDGIADFYVAHGEPDDVDVANSTWLDEEIVQARDTAYSLSCRELTGMQFCMAEMARRSFAGCRILEVCMGTAHFTRWLAEDCTPGTEIYAFDFSWPIIKRAAARTQGQPNVVLLRANARGPLPFAPESFDLLLTRLSPFGEPGIDKTRAALGWLKPGGWYFEAGWKRSVRKSAPTEWAIQNGFASAQLHEWQYCRRQSTEEASATSLERKRLAQRMGKAIDDAVQARHDDGAVTVMTYEHLLMVRKPE